MISITKDNYHFFQIEIQNLTTSAVKDFASPTEDKGKLNGVAGVDVATSPISKEVRKDLSVQTEECCSKKDMGTQTDPDHKVS